MNFIVTRVCFLVTLIMTLISCTHETKKEEINRFKEIARIKKMPGIVVDHMDTTISPKNDFYNYVNGRWMSNTEIPEDRTKWGVFEVLRKQAEDDMLEILNEAKSENTYAEGSDQHKAIMIYESIVDTLARNNTGVTPLLAILDKITGIEHISDLQTVLARETAVSSPFVEIVCLPNLNKSGINAPYITTGVLGLPNRKYYLDKDKKSREIRKQYLGYITDLLQYIGVSKQQATEKSKTILAIETQLAIHRLDEIDSKDPRNFNNPMSIQQLGQIAPTINWNKFFSDLGIRKQLDSVIVMQPAYIEALQKILISNSISDLKTVMVWATLNKNARTLSTEIEKLHWGFYDKTLYGEIKRKPLEEYALANVNASVGGAIGQQYVNKKFPQKAKIKAEKMIANIIKAYQERIEELNWMNDSTKTKAIQKLDKLTIKIGYPDEWEDYSKLAIKDGNSYYENMIAIEKWEFRKMINKIGMPVDKTAWNISPQTVNAYFNPFLNEIVLPAAILQPPFYNFNADEAVNYGGIGAVIGHEITHAIDDSGALYDTHGKLSNWWKEEDLKEYTKKGEKLTSQYNTIKVLDSVSINGAFTLEENIGDLGGVLAAYDGLQMHLLENGRPEDIDGLKPEQRFFVSWATIWRTKISKEALNIQINTDSHAPASIRAIVPLLNIQEFYDAFDIREEDRMYLDRKKRVHIW